MATHPTRERRLSRHPASPIVCFGAMSVPGRPCSAARAVTRRGVQEPRRDGFAEGKIHQSARASRGCRIRGDPVSGDPYARATGSARGDTERGRSRVRPGLFGFSNAGRSSDGGPPPGEIAGGIRFRSAFRAIEFGEGWDSSSHPSLGPRPRADWLRRHDSQPQGPSEITLRVPEKSNATTRPSAPATP
jgi:hypothetical protein